MGHVFSKKKEKKGEAVLTGCTLFSTHERRMRVGLKRTCRRRRSPGIARGSRPLPRRPALSWYKYTQVSTGHFVGRPSHHTQVSTGRDHMSIPYISTGRDVGRAWGHTIESSTPAGSPRRAACIARGPESLPGTRSPVQRISTGRTQG